jgi:hypothetical protein
MAAKGKPKVRPVTSEMDRLLENMSQDDKDTVYMARAIARSFGYALTLTIMSAHLRPGHSSEDELVEEASSAWAALADNVVLFALGKED